MPSGPPIYALRLSMRRTFDTGFTGLLPCPTPRASDGHGAGSLRNGGRWKNLRDWFRINFNYLYPPVEVVRWLMGYPPEHLSCAPTATRSSRKSRPSS